ncbi:hypothetical protein KUCAC02_016976 [Chaenocephalus aceratus]|nr:hypothetical protein KUCAC02_016976 [Chaenocephalus aceratus]
MDPNGFTVNPTLVEVETAAVIQAANPGLSVSSTRKQRLSARGERLRKRRQLHGDSASGAPVTVSVFYPLTQVGKRRGGVFLKTGMVAKKLKDETEREPGKSDAWSSYMAEVKKYKAHQCGDDDKTRPLVK